MDRLLFGLRVILIATVALGATACSGDDAATPTDAGGGGSDAGRRDGGIVIDSGGVRDAAVAADGGATSDAGSVATDAGSTETDAGSTETDAGSIETDAGSTDADAGSTALDAGSTIDAAVGADTGPPGAVTFALSGLDAFGNCFPGPGPPPDALHAMWTTTFTNTGAATTATVTGATATLRRPGGPDATADIMVAPTMLPVGAGTTTGTQSKTGTIGASLPACSYCSGTIEVIVTVVVDGAPFTSSTGQIPLVCAF